MSTILIFVAVLAVLLFFIHFAPLVHEGKATWSQVVRFLVGVPIILVGVARAPARR